MRLVGWLVGLALLGGCAMSEPTQPKILVFFQHDSVAFDPAAEAQVSRAAKEAVQSPAALVTVAGYAAANGNLDADSQLAARRAQVVSALLQHDGVASSRIQVVPRSPSNEDETVGARRVEISIGDAGGP